MSKNVEIRLYRRHDLDLIMLRAYGISVTKLMRMALLNYVDGERIKFQLPDSRAYDISDVTCARYRMSVSDPRIIKLLENIKRGYRNQFCKQLLRDALDTAALGAYLSDEYISSETERIKTQSQTVPLLSAGKRLKKNSIPDSSSVRLTSSVDIQKKLNKIAQDETVDLKQKKQIQESIPDFLRDESDATLDESVPDLFEDTQDSNLMSMFSELVSEGI